MYRIEYVNGRIDDGYDTEQDARDAIMRLYPDAEIGHDGDLGDPAILGDRTLFWSRPEDAENDDGTNAIGEIRRA